MSVAAKLSSIASSGSDQKAKTEEYKALLAQTFSAKDVDGLAAFVEHSTAPIYYESYASLESLL